MGAAPGYADTCWPGEDGGPERLCAPHGIRGLGAEEGRFSLLAEYRGNGANMAVIGNGGRLYVLRSIFGRTVFGEPAQAIVEELDPLTLEFRRASPVLPAGPWWMGALVAHADGGLIAVSGRWVHRLNADTLEIEAARELPADRPHNSCLILDDGTLIVKDFERNVTEPALLNALDPLTLADRCEPLSMGETVIARIASTGSTVYAAGADHAMRFHFTGSELVADTDWRHRFRVHPGQGHAWDPVIGAGRVWFLDQGRHRFRISMRGSALDDAPIRLHCVPIDDASKATEMVVCGAKGGAATNPPVVDPERGIAIGYDSANGWITAFDVPDDVAATPVERWRKRLHTAPHLLRFDDTGELIAFDHRAPWPLTTKTMSHLLDRHLAEPLRRSGLRFPTLEPKLARAIAGEDMVVLDIESGEEKARSRMPVLAQSVSWPAAGEHRDVVMSTITGVFRVGVAPG